MLPLPNGRALLVSEGTAVYQADTDVWSAPIAFAVGPRISYTNSGLIRL